MEKLDSNRMIVSCSGASNTGCYADRVARLMDESGQADMICLPKVAINDEKLIEKINKASQKVVVIDGCPINCGQKILKEKRIENLIHINTTDFGITKGKTPLTDDKVNEIINYINSLQDEQ